MVATYNGQPINALYSSTCGGQDGILRKIFEEKLPYLVSVMCVYKHPEPRAFSRHAAFLISRRQFLRWPEFPITPSSGDFSEFRERVSRLRTVSLQLAKYLRENFYPGVKPLSDLDFLVEQGILPSTGTVNRNEVLYRMIERRAHSNGSRACWSPGTARR